MLANAQVSALSRFSFLPRLLPAPQALIRTERPARLEGVAGQVIGVQSGNVRNQINHVAHILHLEESQMEQYQVRIVRLDEAGNGQPVTARTWSPLTLLTLLGSLMAAVLFAYSIIQGDAFSLLAVVLLAVLGTLIGVANYWTLELTERKEVRDLMPSDIVIKYDNGSFLVIKDCSESLARKLYFAPDKCNYAVGEQWYRAISLFGTLLLMGGVIALANANNYCQLAWALAYILLNAFYWVVAALPQSWNWDVSRFAVTHITTNLGEDSPTFTVALWKVIAATRNSLWARVNDVAPNSVAFDRWLKAAEEAALQGHAEPAHGLADSLPKEDYLELPDWDPRQALTGIMKSLARPKEDGEKTERPKRVDQTEKAEATVQTEQKKQADGAEAHEADAAMV